jgi:hypothetical protein
MYSEYIHKSSIAIDKNAICTTIEAQEFFYNKNERGWYHVAQKYHARER